jgi:hypothetical protein
MGILEKKNKAIRINWKNYLRTLLKIIIHRLFGTETDLDFQGRYYVIDN